MTMIQNTGHIVDNILLLFACFIFNFSGFCGNIRESSERHVDEEPQKGVKRGKIKGRKMQGSAK